MSSTQQDYWDFISGRPNVLIPPLFSNAAKSLSKNPRDSGVLKTKTISSPAQCNLTYFKQIMHLQMHGYFITTAWKASMPASLVIRIKICEAQNIICFRSFNNRGIYASSIMQYQYRLHLAWGRANYITQRKSSVSKNVLHDTNLNMGYPFK